MTIEMIVNNIQNYYALRGPPFNLNVNLYKIIQQRKSCLINLYMAALFCFFFLCFV